MRKPSTSILPPEAARRMLLNGQQARAFLGGISRKKLWEMSTKYTGAQRLPSIRVGGSRMYPLDKLMYYCDLQEQQ